MTQTASAFGRVESALTFFINYYTSLANFKSVLDRLASFDKAIDTARRQSDGDADRLARERRRHSRSRADALSLPDGRRIVHGRRSRARRRASSVLLTGPSGSGKSTLFRAIAGIWPLCSSGAISVPQSAQVMLAPQRPYIPMGTLAEAVVYPAASTTFARSDIEEALVARAARALRRAARRRQ